MSAPQEMIRREMSLDPKIMESLALYGDVSRLNPSQRTEYYIKLCESVGLSPGTQPFKLMKLNGKELFYCDKGGAEQLRMLHSVSLKIVARETVNDVYAVTAQATLPGGRNDESIGVVPIGSLKGESLANAIMKAETKAKRRVTLSVLGLGMLDESELDTIPRDSFTAPTTIAESMHHNGETMPKPLLEPKSVSQAKMPEIPERFVRIPKEVCGKVKKMAQFSEREIASLSEEELTFLTATFEAWTALETMDAEKKKFLKSLRQDLLIESDQRRLFAEANAAADAEVFT